MPPADLRIFSYQPNPRIFKALIAARLCGVNVEVRGAKPRELADWLWDFDAVPLDAAGREAHADAARTARTGFAGTLYKTDAFLAAHPYGTVPAAFSGDGSVGIFESNSIMRAVARLDRNASGLYGQDAFHAARIDGFLDVALVFARESQRYLLALACGAVDAALHTDMRDACDHWLGGIERALGNTAFIAGDALTLADICYACERALLGNEQGRREVLEAAGLAPIVDATLEARYPRAAAHYARLCRHEAFAPELGPYLEHAGQ